MDIHAGVLAIGNEVVEGQIINRNAAWLSERLEKLGANMLYHMACRDQHDEITCSLNYLGQHCHLIIATGGLGPTKDDTTRRSLAQWVGLPLETHKEQWQLIEEKLLKRQVTIREGHRTQALIPVSATPLDNKTGVAPGFLVKAPSCFLASLPGPPNEMQPMFENFLKPLIIKNLAPAKSKRLKTWICLGAPESEVAHVVESLLGDRFDIGYRLHKPYVEVKVWVPVDWQDDKLFALLEEKLKPWFVGYSIGQIRDRFKAHLEAFDRVYIMDHLTSGLMLEKLKESSFPQNLRYQCFEHQSFRFFTKDEVQGILQHIQPEREGHNCVLGLFPSSENSAWICFDKDVLNFETPRSIPIRSQLGQLYIVEKCFLHKN